MRLLVVSCFAVLGCSNGPSTGDASLSDAGTDAPSEAAEWCDGDINGCCANSCDNDVGTTAWVCVNGARTCPPGTYSDIECKKKNPCMQIFCALPTNERCITCDGGSEFPATCDFDAAAYVCPAGSYVDYTQDASSVCN